MAFFFRGKDMAVVGGGDTACEEASYLSKLGRKVYMIVRRDELRASKAMQRRVMNTPNIEILWNHLTREVLGDGKIVTGALLENVKTGAKRTIDVEGFFVAIGHKPNTELFAKHIHMHDNGYIKTKPGTTQTNIHGVFAAGDVQDHVFRQAVTAAGTGCMAAMEAERYLALDS